MDRNAKQVEAFDDLYEDTFSRLLAYCRRRSRSESDADDAVADTYLIAWRRIDDALAADSPLAWLYGVAHRVLANQYRSSERADRLRQRVRFQRPGPPRTEPAETVVVDSEMGRVFAALGRLDPVDQELIRLAAFEELSYADISVVLEMRIGAVRSRLFRARRRLEAILERDGDRDSDGETERDEGGRPDTHRSNDASESMDPTEEQS